MSLRVRHKCSLNLHVIHVMRHIVSSYFLHKPFDKEGLKIASLFSVMNFSEFDEIDDASVLILGVCSLSAGSYL